MNTFCKVNLCVLALAAVLTVGCLSAPAAAQKDKGNTVTVTFNLNGKTVKAGYTVPQTQHVQKNDRVRMPKRFEITDDTAAFYYWTADKEHKTPYQFQTPVTAPLTLYAVYGEAAVVTLNYHNGTANESAKAKKDGTVLLDYNPMKANALFKHWSDTENGEKVTAVTPNTVLHAVYHTIDNAQIRIRHIQGTSHTSPEKGTDVTTVPGVVTALTYSKGKPSGFYMQDMDQDDNPATSEGISVYCGKNMPDVKVGDAVTVTGKVNEYAYKPKNGDIQDLSTTQINIAKKDDVMIISSNNLLPKPVELKADSFIKTIYTDDLNVLNPAEEVIDYYESLEGMRVSIPQPKVVAAPYKDTQYLAPADTPASHLSPKGTIILPDNYNSSTACIRMYPFSCFAEKQAAGVDAASVAAGDAYTGDIIGVMDYAYSNYQVQLTEALPPVVHHTAGMQQAPVAFDASKLNIVSYNLENFSKGNTEKSQSSGKLAPERAEGFAQHLVTDMKSPDVICLIEIQDDNSEINDSVVTAAETLKLLTDKIAAISGAPEYTSVNIDPEVSSDPSKSVDGGAPGANIRCCYLYRTDRIELVADSDGDFTNSSFNTEAEIEADGSKLKQNPARIGTTGDTFKATRKSLVAHFKFKDGVNEGKDFFVINNHLSSKRGDQPVWGKTQPPVRGSEAARHKQADMVVAFINAVKKAQPHAAVISVGDYNDFWFSETVKKFKDAGMKNAIEELDKNERYTYVYNGHFQTLDNILVTDNIQMHNTKVLHINAEAPVNKRLSDHDPVFVQLSW